MSDQVDCGYDLGTSSCRNDKLLYVFAVAGNQDNFQLQFHVAIYSGGVLALFSYDLGSIFVDVHTSTTHRMQLLFSF